MVRVAPYLQIHHCTSQPYRFFGRQRELALLDHALEDAQPSVIVLIGPGGQGKTAIVQYWLEPFTTGVRPVHGLFLWSFYRGKEVDHCLRALYAFAMKLEHWPEVSAAYCVDRLLPLLRGQQWIIVLDGTEVVQYDSGPWFGRVIHPELSRLLEELASERLPGVVVLTTRFPLPELQQRSHAGLLTLDGLDAGSARALLRSLQVQGSDRELEEAAAVCGFHAKAVELLGTYLVRFQKGQAAFHRHLPAVLPLPGGSDEENRVTRVVAAFQVDLAPEAQDILALATAFREPPSEKQLLEYLVSYPVDVLLHGTWQRTYPSFQERGIHWLAASIQDLIDLRLLERVGIGPGSPLISEASARIDAHPLVRRTFESVLGDGQRRESAQARAGFLSGRPERRRASNLDEAREEVELFHAYCAAGLWEEADATLRALDKPRYRFLAPAFERDLLQRFFPGGDWRRSPLWAGFDHYRSLAICLELLGAFEDALDAYRLEDGALRGDALIALGRLEPLLTTPRSPPPWQMLWQAYRAHALCLVGRVAEATALAGSLVPVDVYEWTHVFECLLRSGRLAAMDMRSFLYRPPHATEHFWSDLARQRMRADYLRMTAPASSDELGNTYEHLLETYDRAGLPYERALTRLSHARWLLARERAAEAQLLNHVTLDLARRHGMRVVEADAWHLEADLGRYLQDHDRAEKAAQHAAQRREEVGYRGPSRR